MNKTTWNIINKETHRKAHSTNVKFLNIDGITTDNRQLVAETFNNYFTSIAENINPLNAELNPIRHLLALLGAHHILHVSRVRVKTTDRNAYIQNKNTPDTANTDTSSQYVKEVKKLRYTTFQSKPTTTTEIENIIKTLKPKNSYGYNEI
jgi:hypothetical protein